MELPARGSTPKAYWARKSGTHICCDRKIQMGTGCYYDEDDDTDDYCFNGRHTTDPEEVEYFDHDRRMGNEDILKCEDVGCGLDFGDLENQD
ncbi:hypothetical protein FRC07_005379 [Ceratobasidium sp. 392]|nr:hypothetical protein FRC07_005379 [Ceratobasidium sp. 392]